MTVAQPSLSDLEGLAHHNGLGLLLSGDGVFKTIQGEGPKLGRLTTFIRLGACNLKCTWCDTPYTWDWTRYDRIDELYWRTFESLKTEVLSKWTNSLTFTGGEPLIQWRKIEKFLNFLAQVVKVKEVNFETNGTIIPEWSPDFFDTTEQRHYVVSPKLRNSGNGCLDDSKYLKALNEISWYWGRTVTWKFVCETKTDLDEVAEILETIDKAPGYVIQSNVWIMPQGTNSNQLTQVSQTLVDEVINRGWNLTTRFHVYLWDNQRAK